VINLLSKPPTYKSSSLQFKTNESSGVSMQTGAHGKV